MGLRDIDRDRTHGRPILNRVKTLVSARPLPSTEAGDGRGRLPPQSVRFGCGHHQSFKIKAKDRRLRYHSQNAAVGKRFA